MKTSILLHSKGLGDDMQQTTFDLTGALVEFVNNHQSYGFRDRNELIQAALLRLQEELERQNLRLSANLYAELYEEDSDLQELTEVAIVGWPE